MSFLKHFWKESPVSVWHIRLLGHPSVRRWWISVFAVLFILSVIYFVNPQSSRMIFVLYSCSFIFVPSGHQFKTSRSSRWPTDVCTRLPTKKSCTPAPSRLSDLLPAFLLRLKKLYKLVVWLCRHDLADAQNSRTSAGGPFSPSVTSAGFVFTDFPFKYDGCEVKEKKKHR